MLPPTPELAAALTHAVGHGDPDARAAAAGTLRELRLGGRAVFAAALGDPEPRVRIEAVRALVVAGADALAPAAGDASREVRVALAKSLAGAPADVHVDLLGRLAADPDPLVRGAALASAGAVGCPAPLDSLAVAAVADAAWQVRQGAALALGGAPRETGLPALVSAAADTHADVRRAAVASLAGHARRPEVAALLRTASTADPDADVRAYARKALAADTTS